MTYIAVDASFVILEGGRELEQARHSVEARSMVFPAFDEDGEYRYGYIQDVTYVEITGYWYQCLFK